MRVLRVAAGFVIVNVAFVAAAVGQSGPSGLYETTDFGPAEIQCFSGSGGLCVGKYGGLFDNQSEVGMVFLLEGPKGRFKGYWAEEKSDQHCDRENHFIYGTTDVWGRVEFLFDQDYNSWIGQWGYCDETLTRIWNGERGQGYVPAGFTLNPDNGHYYKFFADVLSTAEAKARAASMGGYLATVTSPEENAFVMSLVNGSWNIRINGSDMVSEGTWMWQEGPETGEVFWANGYVGAFAPWAPGEPNNGLGGSEGSIMVYVNSGPRGQWNDAWDQPVPGLGYVVEIGG